MSGGLWPEGAAGAAAGVAGALLLYALLYHNCLRGTRCPNAASLRGKTVLLTGGNRGIGKATALDLARRGARVVLACRDPARGEAAAAELRRASGGGQVRCMSLDLASLRSVRAFARAFLGSEARLDVLIHNAGLSAEGASREGLGLTFQVNHLGPFLLTLLLLERLRRCAPSRVVVVASRAHRSGKLDPENIHKPAAGAWPTFLSYCNSKLANILFVRELAGRLEGTDVTCYALHPGVVNTDLFRHMPAWLKPFFFPIAWLFFRDAADGAQTSIYCATQEGIEAFSGRYFADCQVQEPRPHARDDAAAKKLWELSERLVGMAA